LETELVQGDGRIPRAAVSDHGVEDREELSHAGDLGDFRRFSFGSEPVVKEADDGIPLGGRPDAEVEGGPNRSASTPDHPLTTHLATIPGEGSHTDQGGDLSMREATELRELGDQGAREIGTDPGDALQEITLGGPEGTVADHGVKILIHIVKLTFEPTDVLPDPFLDGLESKAKAVLLGRDHVDDLAPAGYDRFQGTGFVAGQLPHGRPHTGSEQSQSTSIDGIRLGELARALGEVPCLPRIGDDHRDHGCGEGRCRGELETPGGLEDDQARIERLDVSYQLGNPDLTVGEAPDVLAGVPGDVEPILANIDAHEKPLLSHSTSPLEDRSPSLNLARCGLQGPGNCPRSSDRRRALRLS